MKYTIAGALLLTVAAVLLGGCSDSEAEKVKEQGQRSKDLFDMGGPTDRSKSKGFTP